MDGANQEHENPYTPPDGAEPALGSGDPPDKDACTMGMLAHLLGALTSFVGPLIIWLIKKDDNPFVDDQGKEALNFQLTMLIGQVAAVTLAFLSCGFLFFLPLIPWLLQIIFGIMGAVAANNGQYYRYPLNIRMIT